VVKGCVWIAEVPGQSPLQACHRGKKGFRYWLAFHLYFPLVPWDFSAIDKAFDCNSLRRLPKILGWNTNFRRRGVCGFFCWGVVDV